MGKNSGKIQDNYDLKPVGSELRQGPWTLAFVFFAWCCSLNSALIGAALGTMTDFKSGVWASAIACIILIILGIPQGIIGQRTGLGTGMICRYSFGISGSKITASICALCMWGFLSFDMWTGAAVFRAFFSMAAWNEYIGFALGALFMAAIAAVFAYKGITGVKWVSIVTTPIAIILFIVLIIACVRAGGGMDAINAYQPDSKMSFALVVNAALGVWINGIVLTADMTRTAANGKAVAFGVVAGMIMSFVLMLLGICGLIGVGAYGVANLGLQLGGALFFVVEFFTLIAMGNTVPGSDYVISTNWSTVFNRDRRLFCIVVPIVAMVIGTLIEFVFGITIIQQFLNALGILMPPVIGVTLVDYYIICKGNYGPCEELTVKYSPSGLIAYFAGGIVSFIFTYILGVGIPAIFGIIVTMIVYYILKKANVK